MDYKEVRETIDSIIEAVQKGEYTVSYDEPNNIRECTAPDGRKFYKVLDLDDATSANDFGYCTVEVCGREFSCNLNSGDYESDLFDELEDVYNDEGEFYYKENIIEEVVDAFNDRDDIHFYRCDDDDDIVMIYERCHDLEDIECYSEQDDECPIDIDDEDVSYIVPKELNYGTLEFNDRIFYLVTEPDTYGDEFALAVDSETEPDDQFCYPTVALTMKKNEAGELEVTSWEPCCKQYDATTQDID